MRDLLGRVRAWLGDGDGLIGRRLASAQKQPFFTWFHLVESGHRVAGRGPPVILFRPSGAAFQEAVRVEVTLGRRDRIARLTLCFDRTFLVGPRRPFALDCLKSALQALSPHGRRPLIDALVSELDRAMGAPSDDSSSPSAMAAAVEEALQVVAGRRELWQHDAEGLTLALSMAQRPRAAGAELCLTAEQS